MGEEEFERRTVLARALVASYRVAWNLEASGSATVSIMAYRDIVLDVPKYSEFANHSNIPIASSMSIADART